ncbi:hypothetical protein N177_3417 [Lutibaculum baratangense AMV1]|uniref:Lysozyme inhibitor LprI N-terminal domain-containing protein n=1 Tax=Lutibaculum baratangense AMV1 TaxID=631454 RepID=V4RD85_9HYPH|nr:hypothetical protein N177_3417 [Lutibaculum baratangense AMV1]
MVLSFECASAIRPDQTMVCASPPLAAMDIQMHTLYTVVRKFIPASEREDLVAGQRAFINTRAACGTQFECIGNAYAERITSLGQIIDSIGQAIDQIQGQQQPAQ